jgi:hypothetical protein
VRWVPSTSHSCCQCANCLGILKSSRVGVGVVGKVSKTTRKIQYLARQASLSATVHLRPLDISIMDAQNSLFLRYSDDNHGHFGGSSRSAGQGLHLNELGQLFHMPNFGCIFLSRGIPVPPTTGTFADSAA